MGYKETLAELKEILSEKYTFRNATEDELDRLNQLAGGRLTDQMLAFFSTFGLDYGTRALRGDIAINGAEYLLKFNTGAVPECMVLPFGFFCVASYINGDALCVDLEDDHHPVYQFSHDLINDSDTIDLWIDGTTQSFPLNRENALLAATIRASSFEIFVEYLRNKVALGLSSVNYIIDKAKEELVLRKLPGGIYFEIENGVLTKCRVSKLVTDITIPDGVTAIGDEAFSFLSMIRNVYIPDGVTAIGKKAFFYCMSLDSIKLPETVSELPERMCCHCYSLKEINIPANVRIIGDNCFEDCQKLRNVMISPGVERIEWCGFEKCRELRSVFIPDTVTFIDRSAFSECTLLTELHWEGKVHAVELRLESHRDLSQAIFMLNRNTLTDSFDIGLKYLIILGVYRETESSDAFAFIKKNYIKMARHFIENDCVENLTLLAQYSEFTSRKRLNELIRLAEQYENQRICDLLIGMK